VRQAIAILDSGVGGLTVAKELMRQLPLEQIIYLGDSARAPYGSRPADEVRSFTLQVVDYLMQVQPKLLVIACNTATAIALEDIRARVNIPIIGVITPGARAAIKTTRTGVVGVIGTEGTIRSGAYEKALRKISPNLRFAAAACPLLVPLVESGRYSREEALEAVRFSLEPIRSRDPEMDCLILGCTHYPFLHSIIQEVMGPHVTLINSAEETAREVSTVLYHKGIQIRPGDPPDPPRHRFLCSGDPQLFHRISEQWLGSPVIVDAIAWQAIRSS
jgi:glutamate racemase